MMQQYESYPLVSIIVTCYNQGKYIREAITSIQAQNYPAIEVVFVDDGSTDNTREEVEKFENVKYVYQKNQGVCVARNNGIAHSTGEYIVFLDADDWFLPDAIATNAAYLTQDIDLGFVSGAHDKHFVDEGIIKEEITEVTSDHYIRLLHGNFIGMFASAMFRREVFNDIQFDPFFRHCQDYDVFLRVARRYKVLHHTKKIAGYRLHTTNKSSNTTNMLYYALQALERQSYVLKTAAEVAAYKKGRKKWTQYYCKELYMKIITGKAILTANAFFTVFKYRPSLIIKYLLVQPPSKLKVLLDKIAPAFYLRWQQQIELYKYARKL